MHYALNCTEDVSRLRTIIVRETLKDLWIAFYGHIQHYKELWKIKCIFIHADGHLAIFNTAFREICDSRSTEFVITPSRTPEINGPGERTNGVLTQTVRCMILGSKLPKSFWSVVLLAACYITNRTITTGLQPEMTPIKKARKLLFLDSETNLKPDVSNLRVYGCRARYRPGG